MKEKDQLLYYVLKYQGEYYKVKHAIEQNEPWFKVSYDDLYVTILDDYYPMKLRQLEQPPYIIFYRGNLSLMDREGVGVIGSRMPTTYGIQVTKDVVSVLKKKYVIVSGLAKGIDGCAHTKAIHNQTIGILGCGIDQYYPRENRQLQLCMEKEQLVISEYPRSAKPYAYHFPWRNRLIAALSKAIVVVEAGMKSGTMLTVNEALKYDIPVYCIPHSIYNQHGIGNNHLISQGAQIVTDMQDIEMI